MQLQSAFLLSALLFVSACGTTSSTSLTIPSVETTAFEVQDLRTLDQKRAGLKNEPPVVVIHFGDESIVPTPLDCTSRWLHAHLLQELIGKQVTLRAFNVDISVSNGKVNDRLFESSAQSVPGMNPVSGALAYAAIASIEGFRSRKLIEVMVDITVEGTRFTGWAHKSVQGRVTDAEVSETIQDALAGLVRQYRATR